MTGENGGCLIPPSVQPGGRALVQSFINSHYDLEVEHGADLFATVSAMRRWLLACRLIAAPARISRGDLERAVAVREGLRELARGNGAAQAVDGADQAVDGAAQALTFVAQEAALLCGVALLLGATLSVATAVVLADTAGLPAGGVLAHSLISPIGAAALLTGWICATTLVAVLLVARGGRTGDLLAVAAAAALALALSRGASGTDPRARAQRRG